MAIFIRGNINQGDECFNVKSRGKQCAFNSLLGLITARKKPLTQWSPTTLNNILVQGDKMYLKVMNNHLIDLPPGVVHLSVKDLPKLVPEPTARSAVRRGLLIPPGYLHPGKRKH